MPISTRTPSEPKEATPSDKDAQRVQACETLTTQHHANKEALPSFLRRDWIPLPHDTTTTTTTSSPHKLKIVTWNARRDLFPGSDCLKWSERKSLLLSELAYYASADIICLQECDRLNDLIISFPHHEAVQAFGHGKSHGLVTLYRRSIFRVKAQKVIHLDEGELSLSPPSLGEDGGRQRRGGTRLTKNIGLVVALERNDGTGVYVATTHLFWHPKFTYERIRQCIILLRAIRQFQQEHGNKSWPAILSGDLNTQPSEPTYQLLTQPSLPLSKAMSLRINESRIVHKSVDPVLPQPIPQAVLDQVDTEPRPNGQEVKEEHEGEGSNSSQGSLPNTRSPQPEDGILTASQLAELVSTLLGSGCRSVYGASTWDGETFGQRSEQQEALDRCAAHEPSYTCFTPLWKLTLDYLFVLPGEMKVEVTQLLQPATGEQLGEGLPRKGITASDHIAIGCELEW
ncbi:hypothetical protein TREMEDRAFT_41666 [Tremella mesenterica DSM 1558]|uniref:uncharacterized protein n=1 Tax=Tremella mesenterica (strain ATCC 24925 / CBS 8224 / DSM 1558 / NBRC 9311 / NRRL Y-6157 / RJB 2259-6 / UBC 559-6) TaxID=578456 RepID=UPI0003F49D43|nr:uncharacterized protein TREMEDRAFT_41666 [Tremella mesenterica DSM 1558]EIW72340.1 hypothetical protein TREMEDRAFT_41666 [Tremella mesenterica DSM 1558]